MQNGCHYYIKTLFLHNIANLPLCMLEKPVCCLTNSAEILWSTRHDYFQIIDSQSEERSARATLDPVGLPMWLQIYRPAEISLCKSTPHSIFSPFSMYTTSSVATLPLAPAAYGHPTTHKKHVMCVIASWQESWKHRAVFPQNNFMQVNKSENVS